MTLDINGGRRTGFDRRQVTVEISCSDRRTGDDRRSGIDRRSGYDRRSPEGLRAIIGIDRRASFKPMYHKSNQVLY